jgi:hypothetical protein
MRKLLRTVFSLLEIAQRGNAFNEQESSIGSGPLTLGKTASWLKRCADRVVRLVA